IEFYYEINAERLPYEQWLPSIDMNNYEQRAQWLLLKELVDNGEAENRENCVIIWNETIWILSKSDLLLLDIPDSFPFDIKISSDGTLNQEQFSYRVEFVNFDGKSILAQRKGCILRITKDQVYLLNKEQTQLLDSIDAFNASETSHRRYSENLLKFSDIKGLAEQTGSRLDAYLNSTDVIKPHKIRLRLNRHTDYLEILPEIEELQSEENIKFQRTYDSNPTTENIYSIEKDDGGRKRIVFTAEQLEALKSLKRYRKVSDQEAEQLAECPQEYFDPEVFELEPTQDSPSFSDRVKELGFYKPRAYPFVSPYKSKWIPGIETTDARDPTSKIKIEIKSEEELAELKTLINNASLGNETFIDWKGKKIEVKDIEPHIPFIEKQITNPSRPTHTTKSAGELVLIIEENIDEPAYKIQTPTQMTLPSSFLDLYRCPPDLKPEITIYPHQKHGIAWLQWLYENKHPGGLLADDMGLGKTLQVQCFLNLLQKQHENKKPCLIIAPLTLLENWETEYRKYFNLNSTNIITLYGDMLCEYKLESSEQTTLPEIQGREVSRIREKRGALDIKKLSSADIIITTYETVRDFQLDLARIDWAAVVLDEAQKIKTPGSLVTNAVKALKADFRIAVTGTPVENSLVDLWCITDFVAPGHLGSARNFAEEFQTPLKLPNTDIGKLCERVREQVGGYLLRRLKEDILEGLPKKEIHIEQSTMPDVQLQRYVEEIRGMQSAFSPNIVQDKQGAILKIIQALKSICDHPKLTDIFNLSYDLDTFISQSAKLLKTIEILENIKRKDEKVIIFSDRRDTCYMLHHVICKVFNLNENEVFIVNGDMAGSTIRKDKRRLTRQSAVNRFEAKGGFNAIIMSPLAAGLGLNVTKANHVIHYSRWWNPAKEDQATDRIYRIGQSLPVHVYLPIAIADSFKTFDLLLHELLERKRQLMSGTLFPTEQTEVTPNDIFKEIEKNKVT
ncbi:MAG: DEAD/DEAH box helicase, partial [Candidatus Methanosuratincola sp.]